MIKFKPDMYKDNIYDINYKKLKKHGIKILIYDFDNTIVENGNHVVDDKLKKLFSDLKNNFDVFIISNTLRKSKIDKFAKECGVLYVMDARKPFARGYKKVKNLEEVNSNEICMIGDQLMTDILGAKRMGFYTVLVKPIKMNENIFTLFNRFLELFIFRRLNKKYGIKKGNYYD